jgi:hypothetical protein
MQNIWVEDLKVKTLYHMFQNQCLSKKKFGGKKENIITMATSSSGKIKFARRSSSGQVFSLPRDEGIDFVLS